MVDNSKAFSSYSIDDMAAAKAFYQGTLGLDVTEQPEGLALNLATGASVFLYPKDNHEPATFTVLNFPVDDLGAAIDELTGKGVTMERYDGFDQDGRGIAKGPSGPESGVEGPDGPHIAWFKDPAGNVLSVMQI